MNKFLPIILGILWGIFSIVVILLGMGKIPFFLILILALPGVLSGSLFIFLREGLGVANGWLLITPLLAPLLGILLVYLIFFCIKKVTLLRTK